MQFVPTKTLTLFRVLLVLTVFLGIYAYLVTEAYAAMPSQLVPCGNDVSWKLDGRYYVYRGECDVCDLSKLGMNILNFLVAICIAVAALLFVNAGFLYVTSSSNPGNIARAHKLFTSTLIGLIAILAAYLLIDTAMKSLLDGGEGKIGDYGPWNEILCVGDTDEYKIKKFDSIDLDASELVLPKVQCTDIGGTCTTGTACTSGQTVQTGAECPTGQVCCGGNSSYAQFCTFSATAGDNAGKQGTCTTAASCGSNFSEASATCTGGMVCCAAVAQGQVRGEGFCKQDYLSSMGWSASDLPMAECICMQENSGSTDADVPSTCDVCQVSKVVVSWGLWQINLVAHDVGGYDCTSTIVPPYSGCSSKSPPCNCMACDIKEDVNSTLADKNGPGTKYYDIYTNCVNWTKSGDNVTQWALGQYNKRGNWGDWACSFRKCLAKGVPGDATGVPSCTGI